MEILLTGEVASKLSGLNEAELKARLFEETDGETKLKSDSGTTFLNLVLDKFKGAEREAKEQHYGRGLKEKGEAIEAALKPLLEKFEISAARAEDAIGELAKKLEGEGTPEGVKPNELTTEQIQKLPAYQELLDAAIEKWRGKFDGLKSEYDQFQKSTKLKEVANVARREALNLLEEKKAIFGEEKTKRIDFFWKGMGFENLSVNEAGEIVVLDPDGNPLRDDHKNRVTFQQYIERAWPFGYHEAPPGGGSPSPRRPGEQAGSNGIIASEKDFEQRLKNAKTPKDRADILRARSEFLKKEE